MRMRRHEIEDFFLLILWSIWWGGLTFYAAAVVPIGTELLGSIDQGFITQRVTRWHNFLAGLLCISLLYIARRDHNRILLILSSILGLVALALVSWHIRLTSLMDFDSQIVPKGFYREHAVYLWLTTLEWICGLIVPIFWSRPRASE